MKKRFLLHAILFAILIFGLTKIASAAAPPPPVEPPIIIDPPIMPPIVRGDVRIAYQRVDVQIEDQVATTHIDQLFVNDNDWMLEGSYFFPLPAGAVVSELTMWVDGQPIEAKILQKEEARQIYDEIVRQLRDPALLEYVGMEAIQANVFPIPPLDERRIEIEYTSILPAENGLIHYVYPQSTDLYTNAPIENQSIRVEVHSQEEIRAIYSPSHLVDSFRESAFEAVVGYEEEDLFADQDFELYYTVSPEDIGLNLLSYKESGQDGFFLLLVAPSFEVDPDEIVAKDVLLIIDTSGSMEGDKMAQAQEAARYVVTHLNEQDRFNIVSFSTGIRQYASELVPASEAEDASVFIDNLEALGGTNISHALLEAAGQTDPDRPMNIIFLTDGLATEGITQTPQLLNALQQNAPENIRLFAFGVGNDVDTTLLDSLTENHRGTTTYVRPYQQIDEIVSGFYAKISSPALADIEIDYGDGMVVEQLYPATLPDLFAGAQLVVAGRYRQGGSAVITLRGTVNGQEEVFIYRGNQFHQRGGDDFIPRLWATRAIGHLLNEIRLHGENPELTQSVVNLSIRYGIITPYTSYLIEEDDIFSQMGRTNIVEEAEVALEAMATQTTGESAVDAAADAGDMAGAAAAPSASVVEVTREVEVDGETVVLNAAQLTKYAGNKTFVLRDGGWIDTSYQPDAQTTQEVGFASDAYFELLSVAPQIGDYLALGEQLLFVLDGVAYQIVPGQGDATVTMPASPDSDPQSPPQEPAENGVSDPAPTLATEPTDPPKAPNSADQADDASTAPYIGIFAVALLLPITIGVWIGRRR